MVPLRHNYRRPAQRSGSAGIEQIWFAGVHSDVGGWYDERGLSTVALHWMLEKASACCDSAHPRSA